jgi:hypothetical protein
MVSRRRRSALIVGIALLATASLDQSRGIVGETEAFWTDPEHTSAAVTSGTWPTSGYGRGISSSVRSIGGLSVLPGGTPLPWDGMQGQRTQANPGTATASSVGPLSTAGLVSVNYVALRNAAANGAATGSACGSYSVGSADAPCVAGSTASASASVTSESITLAVAVAGINVATSNLVLVNTAARALSASVSCDLAAGSSTAAAPSATAGNVLVGNTAVPIPTTNSSTSPALSFNDGTLTRYTGVQLHRSVSAGPTVASAHSRLRLTGNATVVSALGIQLLAISFDVYLVSAECGPGAVPSFPPAGPAVAGASARIAPMEDSAIPATSSEAPPIPAESTEPETSETTAPGTTTPDPTTLETASDGPESPVVPETAETTPSASTDSPTQTTTLPTTTTTPPTTTTQPPDLPTVFTGPTDGNVEALTLKGGVVCRAPVDADYSGTVELACDDGTSIGAMGAALTSAGVAASIVDGVWLPVLTEEGPARPVVAATRG